MKFYVGQLLKHNFDPGTFRVLTILEYAIEVVQHFGAYDGGEPALVKPYWISKAGWKDVQSSSDGEN